MTYSAPTEVNLANYQCHQLIHDRFHRLDPILTKLVDIDEVHSMKLLKQTANEVDLRETLGWIDNHFDILPEMEDLTAA